jgi:hypothetical protein
VPLGTTLPWTGQASALGPRNSSMDKGIDYVKRTNTYRESRKKYKDVVAAVNLL